MSTNVSCFVFVLLCLLCWEVGRRREVKESDDPNKGGSLCLFSTTAGLLPFSSDFSALTIFHPFISLPFPFPFPFHSPSFVIHIFTPPHFPLRLSSLLFFRLELLRV